MKGGEPAAPPEEEAREAADECRRHLTSLLAFRLIRLADRVSRGASLVYETRFGISNVELRVLVVLNEDQPLSVNELARRAYTDKGWISRSVRDLEARGLTKRDGHPSDSRVSLVSLTEQGSALVREIVPVAVERHRRLLADLPPEEVDRVIETLERNAEDLLKSP